MESLIANYLRNGGRLIDTAPDYGTGQIATGIAVLGSGIPRKDVWIQSKIDTDGFALAKSSNSTISAYEWTLAQVDKTLQVMKLSYLNSMLLHFGPAQTLLQSGHDLSTTDWLNMWRGLIEAKRLGKVLHIGVCETAQSEVQALIDSTGEVPAIAATWYHPWSPVAQKEYIKWLQGLGVTVQAYGMFNFAVDVKRATLAGLRHNVTWGQFIIQWSQHQNIVMLTSYNGPNGGYLEEDMQCNYFEPDAADREVLGPRHPCAVEEPKVVTLTYQHVPGCLGSRTAEKTG